jgi:hypothetical protein
MAFMIGRVGRDVTLGEPSSWEESADGTVSVSGWIKGLSAEDASWLREQLLGLTDPRGETAVPVSLGHDDTRNGWYQVTSVDVSSLVGYTDLRGDRQWSATLRRLGFREQPRYELHRFGGMWTNDHGIVKGSYAGWAALPLSATAVDLGADTTWFRGVRVADDGSIAFYRGGGTTLYDTVISSYVPIDDAYVGAPRLEMNVSGAGWRTVVGADVRNYPVDWRLTNGLVRVQWSNGGGGLVLEAYDGSSWDPVGNHLFDPSFPGVYAPTVFQLSQQAGSTVTAAPVAIAVLRNDPTVVSMRLLLDFDNNTSRIQWDLSLRRGDRNVINVIKSRTSAAWGVVPTVAVSAAGTAVVTSSGSLSPTIDDEHGHRWVMSIPEQHIQNRDNGAWRVASSNRSVPWGLGAVVSASTASAANTSNAVGLQFYVQATETLMIAGM